MAIHLLGGGWAEDETTWTGRFIDEARERAGTAPNIVCVLWAPTAEEGRAWHADYERDLMSSGAGTVSSSRPTSAMPTASSSAADSPRDTTAR